MSRIRKIIAIGALLIMIFTSLAVISPDNAEGNPARVSYDFSRVHVNVTHPNGTPAEGISVYLHRYEYYYYTGGQVSYTNSTGQAVIAANENNLGPCQITIFNSTKLAYNMESVYVYPGEDIYKDLVLTTHIPYNRTLTGTVYNISNSLPVQDARVHIRVTDKDNRQVDKEFITGADGEFSFDIPVTDMAIRIDVNHVSEDFLSYGKYAYMDPDEEEIVEDVYLTPVNFDDTKIRMRFYDEHTMEPVRGGVYKSGYQTNKDHRYNMPWMPTNLDYNGWANMSLGTGEYQFEYRWTRNQPMGLEYITHLYDYINNTEVERNVPLPIPHNMRNITLEILDSDDESPLQNARASYPSYSIKGDRVTLNVHSYRIEANSTGVAQFRIPADRSFNISVYNYQYKQNYLQITEGTPGVNESYSVSLSKLEDESGPGPATGNISLLVLDSKNSEPLPTASITMYGSENIRNQYGGAGSDGYLNKTVQAGLYESIKASISLGEGWLYNITVEENDTTEAVIYVEGRDFPEYEKVHYSFRLVDPEGDPIPDQRVAVYLPNYWSTNILTTDQNGYIDIFHDPGTISVNIDSSPYNIEYRNHWTTGGWIDIDVNETGGFLGEVTAYPCESLTRINGFVKDNKTKDVIPHAGIDTYSYLDLEDQGTRAGPPVFGGGHERITLFEQTDIGSNMEGFYRLWGRDRVRIQCNKEGYFPYMEEIEVNTRAQEKDILLDPIPEYNVWINGSVVDQNGDPVEEANIWLEDRENDGYISNYTESDSSGEFSFLTYPGSFFIKFGNYTITGRKDIEARDNIEGLELRLIPLSAVRGVVRNYNGTPVEDINVTLIQHLDGGNHSVGWMNTTDEGTFEFQVQRGDYFIRIGITEEFNPYTGEIFNLTGWNFHETIINLTNRSFGNVFGYINGMMGGSVKEIPDCTVHLIKGTDTLTETTTDTEGYYEFEMVEFGSDYKIRAVPPESLWPNESIGKPGLLDNRSEEFEVSGMGVQVDLQLEYVSYGEVMFFNITDYTPVGENVSLFTPIVVTFSAMINESLIEDKVSVSPDPEGVTMEVTSLGEQGSILVIYHDGFLPNTTYHVEIFWDLQSEDGWSLWNYTGLEWEFTTTNRTITWNLTGPVDISVDDDKSVEVYVVGISGLTVVFHIVEIDESFLMTESGTGEYTLDIQGFVLDWETEYSYYFTDRAGGVDKAPELSGTFLTPEETESEWVIISSDVYLDSDGNLQVTVYGTEGISIYIMIDDVGSHKLEEIEPGVYEAKVSSDRFSEDTFYSYYFSDVANGEDKAPSLSGDFRTREAEEEDDEPDLKWDWCCCGSVIVLILIVVIIVVVVVYSRKKGEEDHWEE